MTCTGQDELVAFTPDYGRRTPQGDGLEAVLDARGRVRELRSPRGVSLPAGGSSVQATGTRVAELATPAQVGRRLRIEGTLRENTRASNHRPPGAAMTAVPIRRPRFLLVLAVLLLALASTPSALATASTVSPARETGGSGAPARGAEVVAVTQVADRQVDLSVRSPALGGRTVNVRLLTPDGWDPGDRSRHWPTLWLLHGCCGDYTSWTARTDVARTGSLRDVLVVMPEAGWNGWYSDWWNHGRGGDPAWETFHTKELRLLLEHGWGASANRVVAGLSMGGQGALMYAARHPGMFKAAAAYSGSVHPLLNDESTNRIMGFFAGQGNDPLRVWGDPVAQRDVWAALDPFHLAKRLTPIPVYLSCGDGTTGPLDPPGSTSALEADFNRQNQALASELERKGAKRLTTNFYGPGTHGWPYWQRELHSSLPMLLQALRADG